tara:strand:- start:5328 stop:6137 length:810 start_codon:yes stop_codon:yes gene_type:complete
MKKSILFFGAALIILGLSAYSFLDWDKKETAVLETSVVNEDLASTKPAIEKKKNEVFEDFIYDVGPRFGSIKKKIVQNARNIDAFYDEEQLQKIETLKSVEVILVINDKWTDIREIGYSNEFNDAQLALLQSSDYGTNFIVRADYLEKNNETGVLEETHSTPHLTIVPEKQATYFMGKETLKDYLREGSKESRVHVEPEKLQPAKVFFTVTKNGTIKNVYQDRLSGYPEVDKKMLELILNLPGTWEPAENTKGEKVDQELVVSFGLMGC